MAIFYTNLGGGMPPLALPWLRLCFGPPLVNFLRTPLLLISSNKSLEIYLLLIASPGDCQFSLLFADVGKLQAPAQTGDRFSETDDRTAFSAAFAIVS